MKMRFFAALRMTVALFFVLVSTAFAGEVRLNVGDAAFVEDPERSRGVPFKFDLPEIPQGSRIDFAGLVFHVQRDSVRNEYLSLKLLPITGDWTPASVRNGQVLSVNDTLPSYAVADVNRDDKAVMDITHLVAAWYKGERANHGFYLAPELSEEETKLSVKSEAGVKMELVIYYTGPEKK